jgi:hypothetical protein
LLETKVINKSSVVEIAGQEPNEEEGGEEELNP